MFRSLWLFLINFLLIPVFSSDSSELNNILATTGCSSLDEAIKLSNRVSYGQFFEQTWTAMRNLGGSWNCSSGNAAEKRDLMRYYRVDSVFFTVVLIVAIFLTLLRYMVTPIILDWAIRCRLKPSEVAKVPESIWKGSMHGLLWLLSFYVVILSGRYSFFYEPCRVWDHALENDNFFTDSPPLDLQLIYALQLSHYMHSAFATVFMDTCRADFAAMLFHHLLTISLIALSYIQGFVCIGALVMFLHDISDVLLEFTKLNVYFKSRKGPLSHLHRHLSDLGFIGFASSWALFRLYWFPLKVLHASNWCSYLRVGCVDPLVYVVFNTMLYLLQLLHIYWFWFILVLLFKIVTGQLTEIEDIRDIPDGDSKAKHASLCGKMEQNGTALTSLESKHDLGDPLANIAIRSNVHSLKQPVCDES